MLPSFDEQLIRADYIGVAEPPLGHHYLHVNPDVKHHLGNQLPSEGWFELIVSDLTENGKQLSAGRLADERIRPQIALYGGRFYARASTDKFRPDALWTYPVESGHNPNQVPVNIVRLC